MEARVLLSTMLPLPAAAAPAPAPTSADDGFSAVLQRATQQPQQTQRRQEPQDDPAPRNSGTGGRDAKPVSTSDQRSEAARPSADRQPQADNQARGSDQTQVQDRSTGEVADKQAPKADEPEPQTAPQPLDPALLALLTSVSQMPAQAAVPTATDASKSAPTQVPVSASTAPVVLAQASVQAQALAAQTAQAVTAQVQAPALAQAAPAATAQQPVTVTKDPAVSTQPPLQAQSAPVAAAVTAAAATEIPVLSRQTSAKAPSFGDLLQLVKNQGQPAGDATPAFQQAIDPGAATLLVSGNGTAANALLNAKGELVMQVSGPRVLDPSNVVSQVANSLQVNLAQGFSEVRMKLQPEHLGDVVLKLMVRGNSVQAHAVVSSDAVQQTLDSQVAHLRKQLADSGLNLTGWSVSVGGQGAGLGQAFQQSRRDQFGGQRDGWTSAEENEPAQPVAMAAGQTVRNPWSRLDTRA